MMHKTISAAAKDLVNQLVEKVGFNDTVLCVSRDTCSTLPFYGWYGWMSTKDGKVLAATMVGIEIDRITEKEASEFVDIAREYYQGLTGI